MGLLDSLFSQDSYGGQGGGLLDFLRSNAQNQQFGSGLQSDQAQYGSPMNAMAQQAPIFQPTAQMPPQPPPPQQPAPSIQQPSSGPGIGDRLMAGLQSFAHSGGILPAIADGISGLATGQRSDAQGIAQQQQAQMQNQTAKALLAKGVDPTTVQAAISNPDLLKTLITQTYGPQTVTPLGSGYIADKQGNIKRAYEPDDKPPTSLGSGYIYNPKSGNVERAYEPDDKIPIGFRKTDKGLEPIPNGPADPAYIRSKEAATTDPNAVKVLGKGGELYKTGPDGQPVIVHKNEEGAEATLDDPTVKAMAAQYLAGDKSVLQNLGRGAQGAANIVKIRQEITHQAEGAGLNAKDIVNNFNEQAGNLAGQRSIGTRAANISLAANEANNMIPIALDASAKVPRGEWMPWNKMVQAYQTGTSSPELARFVAATNSLVNAYVRAVSPSGVPTDSMREHAYSMLNSAQSAKAYEAVTSIMQDEMKAALRAPEQVRRELRHEDTPAETSPSAPPKAGDYIWMPGKGLVPK